MKEITLPLVLLIASPALARTYQHQHQHQQMNVGANGNVEQTRAAPSYDVPFAPF
jgi:hypothetical protein